MAYASFEKVDKNTIVHIFLVDYAVVKVDPRVYYFQNYHTIFTGKGRQSRFNFVSGQISSQSSNTFIFRVASKKGFIQSSLFTYIVCINFKKRKDVFV